jgi:hypothetical protein
MAFDMHTADRGAPISAGFALPGPVEDVIAELNRVPGSRGREDSRLAG